MKMGSLWITLFLLGVIYAGQTNAAAAKFAMPKHEAVRNLMLEEGSFKQQRHPLTGDNNRQSMRRFIKLKFGQIAGELGGIDKGHKIDEYAYETRTHQSQEPKSITGTNIYLTLKGSKADKDDEPIVILANYDSDSDGNVVDDNGSGIAALLVLGEYFTKKISSERWKLEHSVVFAATDTSIRKYQENAVGVPQNATSGADQVAHIFLPEFLKDKKSFRGVVVLDSLLIYNEEERTQTQDGTGIDKSFPDAKTEMAKSNYAGNFLALVARDFTLDTNLAGKFEEGWKRSLKQERESTSADAQAQIDPPLIKFVKKLNTPVTGAVFYFETSEQYPIWNHHSRPNVSEYPAILLTDTRKYRAQKCSTSHCNFLDESTEPKNLAFIHRTIMSLADVLRQQTDNARNAAPSVQSSNFLMMTPLVALSLRYILALNA